MPKNSSAGVQAVALAILDVLALDVETLVVSFIENMFSQVVTSIPNTAGYGLVG